MIKLADGLCIEPVFKERTIPVCFSANNAYISQTAIMIKSIVDNSSDDNNYDIIILSTDIDETNENNINSIIFGKENFSVRIFDISSMLDDVKFFTESVYTPTTYSKEAYFRLFIPFVMPEYKKVVYFDGDMAAAQDVYPLIETDLENYMAAATRDFCGIAACYDKGSDRKEYRESIGIKVLDDYFISSMVVLNIEMFNNTYTLSYVKELISSRNWRQHDQDILNILCQDALLIVDPKWSYFEEFDYSLKYLPNNLKDELLSAGKDPCVIHYAGQNKAWVDENSPMTSYFWKSAAATPFFDVFYGKIDSSKVSYKYHIFKNFIGADINYYYTINDIVLSSTPQYIGKLSQLKICVEFLKIENNEVYIDGFFESLDELGTLKLFAKLNGIGQVTYNSDYYRNYAHKSSIKKIRSFNIKLPLDISREKNVIEFGLTYDDIHFVTPGYVSVEQFAPINEYGYSFYSYGGFILTKNGGSRLEFEKHNRKKVYSLNKKICKYLKEKNNKYFTKMAKVRNLYYFSKPFYRNSNIWLISDNSDEVSEECIEFFEFLKSKKGVQPYLVVDANCKNFEDVKKIGNVIVAQSKKHKFLYLHSKVVLASEYNSKFFMPMYDRANEVRDILANKKFVYWHNGQENLSYNVKPWYNIHKFILNDEDTYEFLLNHNNGYTKENLLLADISSENKETVYDEIYREVMEG